MSERSKWAVIWTIWGIYFAVAETKAIRTAHPHAPLSAHLRWCFGVHRKSILGKAVFGGVFAWLAMHLFRVG